MKQFLEKMALAIGTLGVVAIIGDSYVEALQVDFNSSFAELLEKSLGIENHELLRFGISGAPMSQYLHLLRNEVGKYRPDLIIIMLAHNDFNESYEYKEGIYTSSFLKINFESEKITNEISPKKYQAQWHSLFGDYSAIWRYLAYRQKINIGILRNLMYNKREKEEVYQANVPISILIRNKNKNIVLTEFIFRQMKQYANNIGADMIIAMAKKNNIHFIDLHPVFDKIHRKDIKKFEFQCDAHWNAYGHQIVANAIFQYMKENKIP